MQEFRKLIVGSKYLLLMFLLQGCRPALQEHAWEVSYADFVNGLADRQSIADITLPDSEILSTYDRSGGNNDYSYFQRKERDGWYVVADLKGPGYVSRFWTTGGAIEDIKLKFLFDGERKPRIDASVSELRKGPAPFSLPLSAYEQSCWYSYVPITFEKSLKILMSWDGKVKRYYQVNHSALPADVAVESFPKKLSNDDKAAINNLASFYEDYSAREVMLREALHDANVTVPPGTTVEVAAMKGPAVISRMEFEVNFRDDMSTAEREQVLRGIFVHVEWDHSGAPSVSLPLASFGGEIWRCPSYQSMYYGKSNGIYSCRFPMPYRASAVVELENRSATPAQIIFRANSISVKEHKEGMGYFHSSWNRTFPSEMGKPHTVLRIEGKGKYVGCILGSLSKDNSWWLLESDEIIRKDEEAIPSWKGTGLEDYFTGAWYYKNNLVRPLHGLIFKVPYQTIQYRTHQNDAPSFNSSIDVSFERGPDNASHGLMESVAFCYLETPSAVELPEDLISTELPDDPLEKAVVMQTLCNYERAEDYAGASRYIDYYLSKYADVGYAPILRLRQIAYVERLEGFHKAKSEYRAFIKNNTDAAALNYAKLIMWYHSSPRHAIVSANCSNPTVLFVNDKEIGRLNSPQIFGLFPAVLKEGPHLLSLKTVQKRYPEWVHASVRTHEGLIVTDEKCEFIWGSPNAHRGEGNIWILTDNALHEGPPPAPHIWISPHPMVDMQALPKAVWASTFSKTPGDDIVFRKKFRLSKIAK